MKFAINRLWKVLFLIEYKKLFLGEWKVNIFLELFENSIECVIVPNLTLILLIPSELVHKIYFEISQFLSLEVPPMPGFSEFVGSNSL